jgi:SAM-dependent methyltransferase
MMRVHQRELLDRHDVPDSLAAQAYRELAGIHRWLGDTRFIVRAIRRDPLPVRRILDVGCATGVVVHEVGRRLGVEALGVDIHPHPSIPARVPIVRADACQDKLPCADVAFSMCLGHHLGERDLVRLIRNVGRYCRRFILLDLVRHPLPLSLFRVFLTPFLSRLSAIDGELSVRRSYTPAELRAVAAEALSGTGGVFRHAVAPFYIRQVIDISYPAPSRPRSSGSAARTTCAPTF